MKYLPGSTNVKTLKKLKFNPYHAKWLKSHPSDPDYLRGYKNRAFPVFVFSVRLTIPLGFSISLLEYEYTERRYKKVELY